MDVVVPRCGGLDVHKRTVVACVLPPGEAGRPIKQVRTFTTMTDDLLRLADWLVAAQVTQVAMEATGVYWRPVWNVLEGAGLTLLLVNPAHIKAVPGRKTDLRDAEWLAELLRHGLVRGSFVPERAQRDLRELTRSRMALMGERSAEVNRLHKTLEDAHLKVAAVATDIMGTSGRAILAALLDGHAAPAELAQLARGKLRTKIPELERALTGCVGAHHRFLLAQQLAHIDALDETIAAVSAEIAARLRPVEDLLARLDTIPGVGRATAEVLVAEIGTDVARFPTARHLASWAALCPGNRESGGKRQSGRTRKGNPWLRAALVEAGQAAGRTKHTYLGAQYRRIARWRGAKKAAVAVGHSILVIVYHLLSEGTVYEDLGVSYFDERERQQVERRLVQRLEGLGYRVTLEPTAPAA